jgi:hypothetical protein
VHAVVVPLERLPVPLPRLHVHVVEVLHVGDHITHGHDDLVRLIGEDGCGCCWLVERRSGDRVWRYVAVDVEVDTWVARFVAAGEGYALGRGVA